LYEEIVANFGESDAEFSSSKLKDLKYLDMVLKEILRIRPAVPVVQKQLQNDVEIGGWTIPKNMTINLFPYILHHNPKVSYYGIFSIKVGFYF
jgi:cytochrome P450 family 4